MKSLPIEKIVVSENRQRREFNEDKLSELSESIGNTGLLHPIVVRRVGEETHLVAGERRLRAISVLALQGRVYRCGGLDIPLGHAAVTDIGELDPIAAEEAELSENIVRVDLTWQERTDALARLARLKQSQHPEMGFKEVAIEVLSDYHENAAQAAVREAVVLQRAMETDPDVRKAKTQREAMKIVKAKETQKVNAALAIEVGKVAASDLHQVYHADATTWLAGCPDHSFDVVLVDPPYGMGADSFGDAAGKMVGIDHTYDDSPERAWGLMKACIPQFMRVAKSEAHLYIWCDIDLFHDLRAMCEASGWWTHRTPLINGKKEGGRVPWPEHGPRRCWEMVLYAVKGKKPVTAIYPDLFYTAFRADEDTSGHGAAKPVDAYIELLKRSTKPGDRVLDCFAGRGTILRAAHELSLRATAVEIDDSHYGRCISVLGSLK